MQPTICYQQVFHLIHVLGTERLYCKFTVADGDHALAGSNLDFKRQGTIFCRKGYCRVEGLMSWNRVWGGILGHFGKYHLTGTILWLFLLSK